MFYYYNTFYFMFIYKTIFYIRYICIIFYIFDDDDGIIILCKLYNRFQSKIKLDK